MDRSSRFSGVFCFGGNGAGGKSIPVSIVAVRSVSAANSVFTLPLWGGWRAKRAGWVGAISGSPYDPHPQPLLTRGRGAHRIRGAHVHTPSSVKKNRPALTDERRADASSIFDPLVCQRIGPQLDMHGARLAALAALHQPRRAIAVGAPQPAALPAGVGVVDAPVEAFGIKAHRVGDAQRDHLPVLERDEAVVEVGGGHGNVLAEPQRVVLVDPGVIARLGAVIAEAFEAGARILVEAPAFRAVVAGGVRAVERALALAPVEAHEMAARGRSPRDAVLIDVAAADAESG